MNVSTLHRALTAIAVGVLTTGFVGNASADLIGYSFPLSKGGSGYSDPNFDYGIDNAARGIPQGVTTFESTGGSGLNFFVYFVDNPVNSPDTLTGINGGATSWIASNLASAFPPTGLTEAPSISPLVPGSDRNSALYNPLTALAPNGGLFVSSWDANSFTLGVQNVNIGSNAIVGYEITLEPSSVAAVPEPTSLAIWSLLGLAGAGYGWRRRRKAA